MAIVEEKPLAALSTRYLAEIFRIKDIFSGLRDYIYLQALLLEGGF